MLRNAYVKQPITPPCAWIWLRAATMIALVLAGCSGSSETGIDIRLDSKLAAVTPSSPKRKEIVRFVYASVLSPERSTLTYARLGSYLAGKLERPVEIVRRRTYAELNELLRTGRAEAGLVCTGAVAAGEARFGLQAIAIPVIGGKTTYQSFVITRRDTRLTTFSDLQGRPFAFTDPLSNTGYRHIVDRLLSQGSSPDQYFSRVMFTYSHDNSIEAVRDGIVDAGCIDSIVWDELIRRDSTLAQDVIIIERSENFPINPLAVAPSIDQGLREALVDVFLTMAEDDEGRTILWELGTEAFEAPTAETLAGYRAIANSWQRLRAAGLAEVSGAL